VTIAIFLILVGTFVVRACARAPSGQVNAQSRLVARDRWSLLTGFVTAVTAFAIVSLPLEEVIVPGTIWFVGVGLLAGGVVGAVLRWPDLTWYAGTKPRRRAISVVSTLCICALIISVAVI
jgi:hypothetical protein